jgi:hypothetical protein
MSYWTVGGGNVWAGAGYKDGFKAIAFHEYVKERQK